MWHSIDLQGRVELFPEICIVISAFSPLSVKRCPEIAAASSFLPTGTFVADHCSASHLKGKCDPCKEGKGFTAHANGLEGCLPCRQCREGTKPYETLTISPFLMWKTWSSLSILNLKVNCLYGLSIIFALANLYFIFRSDNSETLYSNTEC